MYLLDTNVVSDLRKAITGGAEPRLVAWAVGVPAHDLYLSVVSILELEIGILGTDVTYLIVPGARHDDVRRGEFGCALNGCDESFPAR